MSEQNITIASQTSPQSITITSKTIEPSFIDSLLPFIPVNGGGDKNYRHTQSLPAEVWTITHNLHKKPSVVITDSAGTAVEGSINYIDDNNLIVTFSAGFSGYAELN